MNFRAHDAHLTTPYSIRMNACGFSLPLFQRYYFFGRAVRIIALDEGQLNAAQSFFPLQQCGIELAPVTVLKFLILILAMHCGPANHLFRYVVGDRIGVVYDKNSYLVFPFLTQFC